jgi:hypothetical protein
MKEAMDEMHVASMIDCLPLLDTVVLQRVDWSWVSKKDGTDGLCKSLRALERLRTLGPSFAPREQHSSCLTQTYSSANR